MSNPFFPPKYSGNTEKKYLKALDVPEDGITLKIKTVRSAEVDDKFRGEKVKRIFINFENYDPCFVVQNKANFERLQEATGVTIEEEADIQKWEGKVIVLFRTEIDTKDGVRDAIRVKRSAGNPANVPQAAPVKAETQVAAEATNDEVPF